MRTVPLILFSALLIVGCADDSGDRDQTPLPTAAIRITTPTPEPTSSIPQCEFVPPDDFDEVVSYADFGDNEGRGRGDGVGVTFQYEDGREIEVPVCARQSALDAFED